MSADLSELRIGSLTLSPPFAAAVTGYTAATGNTTNTVTVTAADSRAAVTLRLNGAETGPAVTWADGENVLTATVTNGTATKTYTVTVTKPEIDDDI